MTPAFAREEFLGGFIAEADDHLRSATASLIALEDAARRGETQARPLRELFRSLHTLKGISAMVDVEPVVELAHEMETVLREADRGGWRLTPETVDLLVRGLQAIEQRVRAVGERRPVAPAPPQLLAALVDVHTKHEQAPPRPAARLDLDPELAARLSRAELEHVADATRAGRRARVLHFVPSPQRAAAGVTITSVRERLAEVAEVIKVVPRAVPGTPGGLTFALVLVTEATDERVAAAAAVDLASLVPVAEVAPAPAPELEFEDEEEGASRPGRHAFVRVEVSRLDDALDRLSSLVVTRFKLERELGELRARGADVAPLAAIVAEAARHLRDLRASVMRARMVGVSELLDRVPLLVRGLAQRTGKAVRVEVDAGRAELDKAVAERIAPAIVHLVRNAVDHALEPPDERRRLGKPEEGLVRVTCAERSDTRLELSVRDDGRGIDAERVARRASRPTPEDPAELLELLCAPGLSTLDDATRTSGRGMGMDIVKRTVESLGGDLALRTAPGQGTTFTLTVPLSLSILDAVTFECAGQTFVVPVTSVEEIVDVAAARVHAGPPADEARAAGGATRLLERRGEVIPLVSLAEVFALPRASAAAGKALVVRRRDVPCGFVVDRMLGHQEVVVRPLEDALVQAPGVAGTTDLGDGRATLVLDLLSLAAAPGRPA